MKQFALENADMDERLGQIQTFMSSMPAWYLATCDGDRPHVRPFSFVALDGLKLWLSTSVGKDVYDELRANPHFELSAWQPGSDWLIIEGMAAFGEPPTAIRQAGFKHMVGLGEDHESADDGRLCFFSIDEGHARICNIDGSELGFDLP